MLGAIADDVTGAVDLASNLVSRGFRARLHFGVPDRPLEASGADALVIALKSRTAPVTDALAQSAAALEALTEAGVDRVYVKYCSTFDSTPRGNIGPVCDLVIDQMGASIAVVVPSFPANGRTVYLGHLFVGDVLLNESAMSRHPLTPMTDANIVRVLQQQTPRRVAAIGLTTVRAGAESVRAALDVRAEEGAAYAVVDAADDDDLRIIADATSMDRVVTGGSGLALGMTGPSPRAALSTPAGVLTSGRIILAGSASAVTARQIERASAAGVPILRMDVDSLDATVDRIFDHATSLLRRGEDAVVLIAPTVTAEPIDATTAAGAERAAALEAAFASLAVRFVAAGVRRLIIAGGETSGAVIDALEVRTLELGETIDPGVAWTFAVVARPEGATPVALALKSGNFGGDDFFTDAWRHLV